MELLGKGSQRFWTVVVNKLVRKPSCSRMSHKVVGWQPCMLADCEWRVTLRSGKNGADRHIRSLGNTSMFGASSTTIAFRSAVAELQKRAHSLDIDGLRCFTTSKMSSNNGLSASSDQIWKWSPRRLPNAPRKLKSSAWI